MDTGVFQREFNLALVKADAMNLQFIGVQTPDVCLEALKHNPLSFLYVKNQTEEMDKYILSVAPEMLQFIKSPTPEMCMGAVRKDGGCLKFVPEEMRNAEIYMEAVRQNGMSASLIPQECLSYDICS